MTWILTDLEGFEPGPRMQASGPSQQKQAIVEDIMSQILTNVGISGSGLEGEIKEATTKALQSPSQPS